MLRSFQRVSVRNTFTLFRIQRHTFLTNDYKCTEAWTSQSSLSMLNKVNLNDFYNTLDQNYSSKGAISAIDVDIFANALKEPVYLEELKDLLHKLRLSAETGKTLESTHHATVRNFTEFGNIQGLIDILKDPLNFGVFLDCYTANILLDKLVASEDYELAAQVASLIMLQEDFSNDITCALCKYACYKFIKGYSPPQIVESEEKNKKVEEIKIRVKFLRNPYFDDHFDIKDIYTLSGKTLAWISEKTTDNLNNSLQIIGWLTYKKLDKLLILCQNIAKSQSSKIYSEVIDLIKQECNKSIEAESKEKLEKCISMLSKVSPAETSLEKTLTVSIENAINKTQIKDITQQKQLFQTWAEVREEKLKEQVKRLDRAKRVETIQEKQKELKEEEQKLWFFENEEAIDLQIEEKEKLVDTTSTKKSASKKSDEDYIPPEILPKRR